MERTYEEDQPYISAVETHTRTESHRSLIDTSLAPMLSFYFLLPTVYSTKENEGVAGRSSAAIFSHVSKDCGSEGEMIAASVCVKHKGKSRAFSSD